MEVFSEVSSATQASMKMPLMHEEDSNKSLPIFKRRRIYAKRTFPKGCGRFVAPIILLKVSANPTSDEDAVNIVKPTDGSHGSAIVEADDEDPVEVKSRDDEDCNDSPPISKRQKISPNDEDAVKVESTDGSDNSAIVEAEVSVKE